MGRVASLLAALLALAGPLPAGAAGGANELLRVIAPEPRKTASAHPFINVVVGFGTTENGIAADPATFRARIGRADITRLFRPVHDARGRLVGMRAEAGPALLRVGAVPNRIRFEVRSVRTRKGRVLRDVDKVRFRAVDTENQAPTVRLISGDLIVIPGTPLVFDGTQSTDPEGDELTYEWDFGDGRTSNEAKPTHTFTEAQGNVTVRLTVRDGQAGAATETMLLAEPPICPTCTRGALKIEGVERLEFGAVALGGSGTKTLTVRNTDTAPTSELAVVLAASHPAFTLDPPSLRLGPEESAPVTVSFTPGAEGHQGGEVAVVASASNQRVVHMLAHGYGGNAAGTGPLPISSPVFYNVIGTGTRGIFPSGARFDARTAVRICLTANNGPGFGDYCLSDADCVANGGTCPQNGTCIRGDRSGQPCVSTDLDCPGGFCNIDLPFEPADMCGDGHGGLYLMSDEGSFTDTNLQRETALSGTLARAEFDATGQRTVFEFLARTNEATLQLACDGTPAAAGGRIYFAEYHNVLSAGDCFRDGRESLTAMRKTGGAQSVVVNRIDAVAGLPECEDIEEATDIEMTRDASTVFVSLTYGLFRLRPTPLLITPDVDDVFQVHPDGSVVVATVTDQGTNGVIRVFKIAPEQALNGAPRLAELTPCAIVTVPNNRAGGATTGTTRIASFAVDRSVPGSFDGTILLSYFGSGGRQVMSNELTVRGMVAIASPAASNTCTVLGTVGLDSLDQLTF